MDASRKFYVAKSVNFYEKKFPFTLGFMSSKTKQSVNIVNQVYSSAPLFMLSEYTKEIGQSLEKSPRIHATLESSNFSESIVTQ